MVLKVTEERGELRQFKVEQGRPWKAAAMEVTVQLDANSAVRRFRVNGADTREEAVELLAAHLGIKPWEDVGRVAVKPMEPVVFGDRVVEPAITELKAFEKVYLKLVTPKGELEAEARTGADGLMHIDIKVMPGVPVPHGIRTLLESALRNDGGA